MSVGVLSISMKCNPSFLSVLGIEASRLVLIYHIRVEEMGYLLETSTTHRILGLNSTPLTKSEIWG